MCGSFIAIIAPRQIALSTFFVFFFCFYRNNETKDPVFRLCDFDYYFLRVDKLFVTLVSYLMFNNVRIIVGRGKIDTSLF